MRRRVRLRGRLRCRGYRPVIETNRLTTHVRRAAGNRRGHFGPGDIRRVLVRACHFRRLRCRQRGYEQCRDDPTYPLQSSSVQQM